MPVCQCILGAGLRVGPDRGVIVLPGQVGWRSIGFAVEVSHLDYRCLGWLPIILAIREVPTDHKAYNLAFTLRNLHMGGQQPFVAFAGLGGWIFSILEQTG